MPITPHFALSQSLTHVTLDIRVPHVRVSVDSVEVLVDGNVVHFSSTPYLLVLTFPAPFLESDGSECAKYDPSRDGGTISLNLAKEEPSMWPDLDLIGALLTPKKTSTRSSIEIVSESGPDDAVAQESGLPDLRNVLRPHYGFLNLHSGVFSDLAREGLAAEMLELPDPDVTNPKDRREMRLLAEAEKFDEDRYLGDLDIEDDYIYQAAVNVVPHWKDEASSSVDTITKQLADLTTDEQDNVHSAGSYFTPHEAAQLASIPYPLLPNSISVKQEESLFLGMLDILFAYVYDHLVTEGDPTIESSWTICSLSSTLSWLEAFDSAQDTLELVMRHSIRRALIYPYLRNYEFALYCWKQVLCLLQNGRRCVVRSLLHVRSILDKSECHYLGNRLYIDPYLAWIQRRVNVAHLASIADRLNGLLQESDRGNALQKDSLDLNLIQLELQLEHGDEVDDYSGSNESTDGRASETSSSSSSTQSVDENPPCTTRRAAEVKETSAALLDSQLGCGPVYESVGMTKSERADDSVPPEGKPLIEEL